jgi:hypothetical protein
LSLHLGLHLGKLAERIENSKYYYFRIQKSLDESLLHGPPEADDQSFLDCQQLSFGSFGKAMEDLTALAVLAASKMQKALETLTNLANSVMQKP